jgi:asparagine synthase (glutamine-hydrolysing)
MCGLFGFVNLRGPAQPFVERGRKALDALAHRGPDQWGESFLGNVYCGHRRLSILDVSEAGRQPMKSADGQIALTANGEIYNFAPLRGELEKTVRFTSHSDSEVALHGYSAWGLEGLAQRLDGMYALAIHDDATRTLALIRDRVGIKPLYYALVGQWFVWASELRAITTFLADEALAPDNSALFDLLTYRYIPGAKTPYAAVRKLLPGHFLTLDVESGRVATQRYWSPSTEVVTAPDDELAAKLRDTIGASVRAHLASDVPLGTFLSGGMDSTIISYHATREVERMHSFSIGFDFAAYDETAFARIAAEAFGTVHHEKKLERSDSGDLVKWMRSIYGEPFGDYSSLPTWHVSKLARSHVTVALSGDGGDELFGGYAWYERIARIVKRRGPFARLIERSPIRVPYAKRSRSRWQSALNRVALYAGMELFELYVVYMNAVPRGVRDEYRKPLGIPADYDDYWHLRQHFRPEMGLRRALQFIDFNTYLPDDILTKVDRASMAVSLECRVPFLSRDVVELAFTLPERFLYKDGALKGGLKYAYRDVLPPAILKRPKKGFGIPTVAWGVLGDDDRSFEQIVLADYFAAAQTVSK